MRSTSEEIAALRVTLLAQYGRFAEWTLLAIACVVFAIIAVREGETIGHVLGVLGIVAAWIARRSFREIQQTRAAIRDLRDELN